MDDSRSPRRARFVAEYLVDRNATKAAERAGYSPKTAASQGSRLLKDAKIASAIAAAEEKLQRKTEITAAKVVEDISRIAASAEDAGEFNAALKGHELLGKHLGIFTDKVEVKETTETSDISDEEWAALSRLHHEVRRG